MQQIVKRNSRLYKLLLDEWENFIVCKSDILYTLNLWQIAPNANIHSAQSMCSAEWFSEASWVRNPGTWIMICLLREHLRRSSNAMHGAIIDETLAVCIEHRAQSWGDTSSPELYVFLLSF